VHNHFLAVDDVTVSFGKGAARAHALRNVSMSFRRSTLSVVMGPSGSGKTTLLSVLGCLLTPDKGTVYVDGVEVQTLDQVQRTAIRRDKISFVFQAFRLIHSLSAIDNVSLALQVRGATDDNGVATARELLSRFGLQHKLNVEPNALSPGEKQRVAVARALIGNPPIILADEPTASLDAEAGTNICQIMRQEVDENKRTVVVVSHDPKWQQFADETVHLSHGEIARDEVMTS
jgi:putative ABC transport system ATP-binding protein